MNHRAKAVFIGAAATLCSITLSFAKPTGAAPAVQPPQTAEAIQQLKRNAEREHADEHDSAQAARTWDRTSKRQAKVDTILARKEATRAKESKQLSSALLKAKPQAQQPSASVLELLTLKPVVTGREPQVITFEVPISYEAVTNVGKLLLAIDPIDGLRIEECSAVNYEFARATNGNCLLLWQTGFDTPGQHALQAVVISEDGVGKRVHARGPLLPFVSSNICQYSESSLHFDPSLGATLMAKVAEPKATYSVDFISVDGEKVRTITGTTTNGVIKVYWDLKDDRGQLFTGDAFDSVFHVTLPSSGKSFTQAGP